MPNRLKSPRGSFRLYPNHQNSPMVGVWLWEKARPKTVWASLEDIYDSTHNIAAAMQKKKSDLKASGKLTEAGVLEQMLASAGDVIRPLAKAKHDLEHVRAEIDAKRAGLKL